VQVNNAVQKSFNFTTMISTLKSKDARNRAVQ